MKRYYYKITMELLSPLAVGCGKDDYTDSDILRNSKEIPYVPGTAMAGLYRHLFNKEEQDTYFGKADGEKQKKSSIITYDANLQEQFFVSKRDNVALDDWKTAIDGAKFDFEILEPGVHFITYLETADTKAVEMIEQRILPKMAGDAFYAGAKTSRGFGQLKATNMKKLVFDMERAEDAQKWLDFNLFADAWEEATEIKAEAVAEEMIVIPLRQEGGISIRRYTTKGNKEGQSKNDRPDNEQLTIRKMQKGTVIEYPVIPGTTWAGAIHHRIKELNKTLQVATQEELKDAFGDVTVSKSGKEKKKKSKIVFYESQIKDAIAKTTTRNAIDRFTGGTKQGALFTEKSYYNGTCELRICLAESIADSVRVLLDAALLDLCNGYLAVGGNTAIGRGIFSGDYQPATIQVCREEGAQ